MSLEGFFKGFIDGVYVIYDRVCVPMCGVLNSMRWCCLLPRNIGSLMNWPLGPVVYPTVLIRSGMWCISLWCAGGIYYGIGYEYSRVFGLSSCRPSYSGRKIGERCM